jgi:uncharacterized membrane protein
MRKVYAKNPAEIGELIIDNPAPKKKKVKKDPRRVAAGKQSWKTRQQNKKHKKGNRMNPEKYAKTGKSMLMKSGIIAVGTFGGVRLSQYLLDKFGQNLPAAVRQYGPIAIPAVAGIVIGTKAKQKNHLAQGVANGMVFAAVSAGLNRVLPASVTGQGLSDAIGFDKSSMLADGNMIVTPDGMVMDKEGNPFGKAVLQLEEPKAAPSSKPFFFEEQENWETAGEQYG